ncbi:nucleotidyl transferase [Burkholderia sp. WAC0059]|uniref:nucleotidyltransferase family protein n=1 Tax=Burkholderia sp. WAC0059 TaxID=2066022 RepID=UPI000C7F15A1|nr:nucleotidyltransferase family protein [Burkholderia sp. WAC0059]PLZ01912.1 nucleotidyl transferase [Burkholderia sp. WAC0059]
MKALLLAAGLGTRLRPLTERVPKCLVPVGGRPLLQIWLERLADAGCGPFLINAHYLAEQVEAFVSRSAWPERITLTHESVLLGTAGTVRANLDFFDGEDGLLVHADNYCLADIDAFIRAHRSRPADCLMTMMTFRTETPSSCGIVTLDTRGVVTAFDEKPAEPKDNLANGAIYLLSAAFLDWLRSDAGDVTDFSTEVLPRLLGRIYTYETSELLIDIGTPQSYARANALHGE